MKRILMIAYHFPPLAGSSGIQRTLRFVQHLPSFGWEPLVISADPRAYERTSDDLLADVPPGTLVKRAFALDTARHLSLGGRYIGSMARPDRWISWKFDAVRQGMRLIREYRPDVIWSTYPIATAHVIGSELHRRSGIPWVADFRDPMAQEGYPADPQTWQAFAHIEAETIRLARYSLFTTPGAARLYRERYPAAADRIQVLENGYDEESFASLTTDASPLNPGAITLLHSGIVYPTERDPTHLILAIKTLKNAGIQPSRLKFRFRATSHDELLKSLAAEHHVAEFIECCPPIPYREALSEMLRADGLLVMQAASCNEQIPAKLYEYVRAQRPVIALTDPAGDTANTLRQAGIDAIARLDSPEEIAHLLGKFLNAHGNEFSALPTADAVRKSSRRERTAILVNTLETIG